MEIQFIDEEISSFGGVAILKKMMDKLSFEKVLSSLPLPPQKSPRGYPPIQITYSVYNIAMVWRQSICTFRDCLKIEFWITSKTFIE